MKGPDSASFWPEAGIDYWVNAKGMKEDNVIKIPTKFWNNNKSIF